MSLQSIAIAGPSGQARLNSTRTATPVLFASKAPESLKSDPVMLVLKGQHYTPLETLALVKGAITQRDQKFSSPYRTEGAVSLHDLCQELYATDTSYGGGKHVNSPKGSLSAAPFEELCRLGYLETHQRRHYDDFGSMNSSWMVTYYSPTPAGEFMLDSQSVLFSVRLGLKRLIGALTPTRYAQKEQWAGNLQDLSKSGLEIKVDGQKIV